MLGDEYREEIESTPVPEREPVAGGEQGESQEVREVGVEEEKQAVRKDLEKKVEETELPPEVQQQVVSQAAQIQSGALNEEAKVKRLVDMAQTKGVIFALKAAKEMRDDYILDMFHDALVKDKLYKQISD